MIKACDLISVFRRALDEKMGYIWGTSGQTWTAEKQAAATRDMTVKHGKKWIGRRVADCSGLFVMAYKEHGEKIYHGSNTIWNKHCSAQGDIMDGMAIKPGTAVFQRNSSGIRHHIGLYVGGGKCIEAHGTQAGVIQSDVSGWDEWGELAAVDYTGVSADTVRIPPPTLRSGSKGAAVKDLQGRLNALGHDCGTVDGVFGKATRAAVKAFQASSGIDVDGICGPDTWAALEKAESIEGRVEFTVCIPGLGAADATALVETWPGAYVLAEKVGNTDG